MRVPSRVGRLFRPVGTIGPAFYIALTFAGRSARDILGRSRRRREAKAERALADADTGLAADLLDLDGLLEACSQRLVLGDPREHIDPGERGLYVQVARLIAEGIARDHRAGAAQAPGQIARRSQHAKQHGCIRAQFVVEEALPGELAVGVFRPGARYDAVLRLSNAHGAPRPDYRGDGRGLAIKLIIDGRLDRQDFVLVNHPVFFVDDIAEYARFMAIVHSRGGRLVKTARFFFFFVPYRLRKGLVFLRLMANRVGDPLDASYFSMSAYALGGRVVRYLVTPVRQTGAALPDRPAPADFLRDRLAARLAGGVGPAATFDFSVQLRDRPVPADVERASRAWRGAADRIVRLARIEVPHQAFDFADQQCACENLSFSPWHAEPAHRPLGGINRIRLLCYLASSRMRHRLNLVNMD
jgi:hypothetical protein